MKRLHRFLQYQDPANHFSFDVKNLGPVTITGNHAQFSGRAKMSKHGAVSFTVDAYDNGPTGANDQFFIHASNGYSAGGTLSSGDISIHN